MESLEFIQNYKRYLDMIANLIKPEHLPIIQEMKQQDPHDLVGPQYYFTSESAAIGYLFVLVNNKVLEK